MRHARRVSVADRRQIAFIVILLAGLCCFLTLFWRLDTVPSLFASTTDVGVSAMGRSNLESATDGGVSMPAVVPRASAGIDAARRAVRQIAAHSGDAQAADQRVEQVSRIEHASRAFIPRPARFARPSPRRGVRLLVRWFHGKKYLYWKTLRMRVTSYAPDRRCCYPFNGTTTASGTSVHANGGRLVAADTNIIPFHYLISVPGYAAGMPVPVLDRGDAIKGNRIDVLLPTFQQARHWGSRFLYVKIYRPAVRG